MGKILKKGKALEQPNQIEPVLNEAFLSGEKLYCEDVNAEKVAAKLPIKKNKKIPGVQKEDGSACCGGDCCSVEIKEAEGKWTRKRYLELINQVTDPETGVGITDMGLIYDVEELGDGVVKVTMTLTSLGCPAGGQITTEIDSLLRIQPHILDVKIDVVWEPAWNPEMMNPEIKAMLFGNS